MSRKHWLAAYGEKIPCEINPDAHGSVLEMLEAAMQRFADQPAFRCFGQTLTYADTDRLSRQFAAYLQGKLGVKKGDRIAVMLPNIAAFPLAMLGIVRAGAVQVNVNPLYTPRELEYQLNDAGVETIVIFNGVSATLAEIIGKTAVKQVINVAPGDGTGAALPEPAGGRTAHSRRRVLRCARARARSSPSRRCRSAGDDLLFLQYTGGTTGLSKGAALSHRNLVANTEQFKAFMPDAMRPGQEVVVTALPLYHIFALMVNFITYFSIGADNWLVRQSARHGQLRRDAQAGALHRLHRREHALRRPAHAAEDRRSGLQPAARGDRRRRRGAADDVGEMEGADRQGHPRRLRPVGNLSGPHPQSDDDGGLLRRRWACRCRPPTSSCSTTTTRKRRSASRARSAPRARR